MYRTHTCGELNINNIGENVTLAGHIQKIRNLGNMAFVDLRDEYGITQIVISEEIYKENSLIEESSIQAVGKVIERSNKNKHIPTGDIEIQVEKIKVLRKM